MKIGKEYSLKNLEKLKKAEKDKIKISQIKEENKHNEIIKKKEQQLIQSISKNKTIISDEKLKIQMLKKRVIKSRLEMQKSSILSRKTIINLKNKNRVDLLNEEIAENEDKNKKNNFNKINLIANPIEILK